MRKSCQILLACAGIGLLGGLAAIAEAYGAPDTGPLKWLWFLFVPLPLYLLFRLLIEFIGELLHDNRVTRYVEQKTAAKSFSLLRIGYNLLYFLLLLGSLFGALYLWRTMGPG